MDNTYAPTEDKIQEKIKVDSIDTIVTMHGDKPYYENKYKEVGDKCYHIGYSSYYLDVALEYRKKYFEVVERESDWIPISERLPEDESYILVSFENCTMPDIARYEENNEGGTFYPGDDEKSYSSYGIFVNAWMPLPEPYREEDD